MKKIILIAVAVIVVLGAGAGAWFIFGGKAAPYYAVYLETGDVYFGQVTRLPFGLKNAYILQVNPQDEQNPLALQRFSNLFWEPEGNIKINKKKVVWMAKLKQNGNLAEMLKTSANTPPAMGNVQNGGLPINTPATPPLQEGRMEPLPTSAVLE